MNEMKLVPVEPTEEMWRAGSKAAYEYTQRHGGNNPLVIYKSMLAAAPTQPSPDECQPIQLPENEVHKRLTFLTKRDQGRVMGVLREFGILYNPRDADRQAFLAESDKEAVRNAALEEAIETVITLYEKEDQPYLVDTTKAIESLKSQPAQPSDKEAVRNAEEILGNAIYDAAKKVGIANDDHSSLSTSQLLHLLDCMTQPAHPSDSRTEFSDTELLNWVTENRAIVDYYGNGYRVCFIDDGSFYPEVYPTIKEAIKSAMKSDKEGL